MKWFIYMYPRTWRKRYGEELIEVLNQTDKSFNIVIDLLLGVIDAWHVELTEKDIYGYRISLTLVLTTFINIFIVLKLKPLKEVIWMEQTAMVVVLIAMLSLFLVVVTLLVSLIKFGVKGGFSLKQKLTKTSLGLMGVYTICITTFIVLVN